MTDYGHDLRFGTFLTPDAGRPDTALPGRTDGNLRTRPRDLPGPPIQPGFPRHLDADDLGCRKDTGSRSPGMSSTCRCGRRRCWPGLPPASTSCSRAGSRWGSAPGRSGIRSKGWGARRLSAGQAVDALGEAIDLMREAWDTSTRARIRHTGEYYQAPAMQRGPRPFHRIGFWIGAYKPRMLRLTGTKGDGWVPSLGYIEPHEFRQPITPSTRPPKRPGATRARSGGCSTSGQRRLRTATADFSRGHPSNGSRN